MPTNPFFISLPDDFALKSGQILSKSCIAYESFGLIKPELDNVILVLPGLSASSHIASNQFDTSEGWWESMVGPDKYIDTNKWHILCCNSLGSCKGSTGPKSINPESGNHYRLSFPELNIEDMADAVAFVVKELGVTKLACVIGISMGGMIALSFSLKYPKLARSMINISSGAYSLPFSIVLRSLQREIIMSDPNWNDGNYDETNYPASGMMIARKLGLLSYQSPEGWLIRFGRKKLSSVLSRREKLLSHGFEVNKYLNRHANIFHRGFDPNSYLYLSQSMDMYDLGEQIGSTCDDALGRFQLGYALVIGVLTDILFPASQQEYIASRLKKSGVDVTLEIFDSMSGHDAFLTDIDLFGPVINKFLNKIHRVSSQIY